MCLQHGMEGHMGWGWVANIIIRVSYIIIVRTQSVVITGHSTNSSRPHIRANIKRRIPNILDLNITVTPITMETGMVTAETKETITNMDITTITAKMVPRIQVVLVCTIIITMATTIISIIIITSTTTIFKATAPPITTEAAVHLRGVEAAVVTTTASITTTVIHPPTLAATK